MKPRQIILQLAVLLCSAVYGSADEINILMMEATCKVQGAGSIGTGFIIGKPDTNAPARAFYTLITANHVLERIKGAGAMLVMRQLNGSNDWERIEVPIRIRNGPTPLWKKHSDVDVAGMFVALPTNTVRNMLTTKDLIGDKELLEYEIHPGMELMCLGYPVGAESNPLGFPILRSGRIASYPLTPTKSTKTFLFDFTVFPGNSGGPVYFMENDPTYGGVRRIGTAIYGIAGLVVEQRSVTQSVEGLYEKRETMTPLQLGSVIHASFIKELVESMGFPK